VEEFKPFEDKEEVEMLKLERDLLISSLSSYQMPDSEMMFIVRKINNITEKLLEKARYSKGVTNGK